MLGASRKEESHNSDRRGCSPTSPAGQTTAWSVNTGLCLLSGKCVSLSWALALFGSPDSSILHILPWRLTFSLGTFTSKDHKTVSFLTQPSILFFPINIWREQTQRPSACLIEGAVTSIIVPSLRAVVLARVPWGCKRIEDAVFAPS